MKHQIICPANCNGGYANQVMSVSQRQAGITPDIARAAKLEQFEKLSTCIHCSCVWRDASESHKTILGEFGGANSATVFQPEPWLEKAIVDLKKEPVIHGN